MLLTLHLGGRNYTCTEIKLSKIIMISAPYPPQGVSLWFQGNGSHLHCFVRGLGGCAATRLEGTGTAGVFPALLPGRPWVVVTVPALVLCARL